MAIPAGAALAAPPPNNTGLTAKIIAHSGQTISGPVNAAGFDIGIYIGPNVQNVTVTGANVTGANDEGILIQDTFGIVIKNSIISNNAKTPATHAGEGAGQLSEDKAIVLAGTSNCQVKDNTVENNGAGGISVLDDGPNHPFALSTVSSTPIPATGNVITRNDVVDNGVSCGIVVAAKNPAVPDSHKGNSQGNSRHNQDDGVNSNTVSNNRVISDPGPNVGGIVVAGGAFGPVNLKNNVIQDNAVVGGLIPGISIHAFGPGNISGTELVGNTLSNNAKGESGLSPDTTGIEIFAVPGVGVIVGTQVQSDTVISDHHGIWHVGDSSTTISGLLTYAVAVATFPP